MASHSSKVSVEGEPKTFVFIDTNIYVRFLSQGKPGCEPEHWHRFVADLQSGALKLLLPEIVMLELEKKSNTIPQLIKSASSNIRGQIKSVLESQIKQSETVDMRESMLSHYDTLLESKLSGFQEKHTELKSVFSHANVIHVPLSLDILLQSKRRLLSGRMAPTSDKPQDADCGIVESLISHFRGSGASAAQLLFCSENVNDFATHLEDKKTWVLHSSIRNDLPDGMFFTDMKQLVEFLASDEPIHVPAPDDIKEAEDRQNQASVQEIAEGTLLPTSEQPSRLRENYLSIERQVIRHYMHKTQVELDYLQHKYRSLIEEMNSDKDFEFHELYETQGRLRDLALKLAEYRKQEAQIMIELLDI